MQSITKVLKESLPQQLGQTDGRTGGQADRRTGGQADRRTGGQADGRTGGQASDGRMDGRRMEILPTFFAPSLKHAETADSSS